MIIKKKNHKICQRKACINSAIYPVAKFHTRFATWLFTNLIDIFYSSFQILLPSNTSEIIQRSWIFILYREMIVNGVTIYLLDFKVLFFIFHILSFQHFFFCQSACSCCFISIYQNSFSSSMELCILSQQMACLDSFFSHSQIKADIHP